MKKILTCVITAILLMTSLLLGGCDSKAFGEYLAKYGEGEIMTKGDFVYGYIHEAGASRRSYNGEYVVILKLSAEGKQKDTIIIPDEIDGKPVIQIGMVGFAFSYDLVSGSKYSNLYLPKYFVIDIKDGYNKIYGKCKYFFMDLEDLNYFQKTTAHFYLSESLYAKCEEEFREEGSEAKLHIANTEFVNDNEPYFIADYENGEKITYIPTPPIKKGYTFVGWYKEPECINIWDFENDAFTLAEGETIMKLYAKWQEVN